MSDAMFTLSQWFTKHRNSLLSNSILLFFQKKRLVSWNIRVLFMLSRSKCLEDGPEEYKVSYLIWKPKNILSQESGPGWMQEARSKYTLCCSGRGTPLPAWEGSTPPPPGKVLPPSAWEGSTPPPAWEGSSPPFVSGWSIPLLSRCKLTHKMKILPSPSFGCGR